MKSDQSTKMLEQFALRNKPPIYMIGTFSSGVTVWGQQIRALNLAWSLIEEDKLSVEQEKRKRIAVVGAGFAGLTFVAALLKKKIACHITLFEEHDTLLPLQQGSDSRWLHPHIYDWPDKGSEADVAMLPILNWTAARASDVVVQVLKDWRNIVNNNKDVALFCNTRHLHLTKDEVNQSQARIEWVGEPRSPLDGTIIESSSVAQGSSGKFDLAILAVGFGIEQGIYSYWRNETIGQPLLNQSRRTFLISGQGDGAMIDLIRVRLSQYRQDRILEEIFSGKERIVGQLKEAKERARKNRELSLYSIFDSIFNDDSICEEESAEVLDLVSRRLRRDTDAILRIQVPDMSTLLRGDSSKMSFQNALLVYLLYRVGGFAPSCDGEDDILKKYSIPPEFVVRRHGTDRQQQFERILSECTLRLTRLEDLADSDLDLNPVTLHWPGGYFDHAGSSFYMKSIDSDDIRRSWRKEYLPGPTTLIGAALCGAVVGAVQHANPDVKHMRVTVHRVLPLNEEELLQQMCDYQGIDVLETKPTAGRTFPARNAMIGLAYRSHRPVHTLGSASPEEIQSTMVDLGLMEAARKMKPEVSYILAIPVLQPSDRYFHPSRVAGVVYLDSTDKKFHLTVDDVERVGRIIEQAIRSLALQSHRPLLGVRNIPFKELIKTVNCPSMPSVNVEHVIEFLAESIAPKLCQPLCINFDYADPASVGYVQSSVPAIGGDAE
ncbi:MAG: FAD-dependent oxidoreductase [Gemmatimonadota bacterium]|nr:FAD-dependent oxidoreductase [Gemmatimonadota bacterium]